MLAPGEFREEYAGTAEFEEALPEAPVTSLRELQHLYGVLYTLSTAGGGEYAAYLTPDQSRDLVGEDESVIAVQVDLSGEGPRLADEPVNVETYTTELVSALGHCKYASARGIDHSVTHRSGRDSSKEKLARYAKERLTRWATDEVVVGVAEDHEDGKMIAQLRELGEDDAALERIEAAVEERLGGPRTALLTVRVKLEPDGEYRWPGELDVFNATMRARKLSKLVSKGEATDSAGEATDLVTGVRGRTVGTAEDPLNYFLGKQTETFPGLDPDEAWRSHPIAEDAAVTLMNAETFVDACTYRTLGADVYYLPYFLGRVTERRALRLYALLHRATEEAAKGRGRDRMTPVEQAYEQIGPPEEGSRLRFYVAAVMKHQSKRYDVFGDTLNGHILYPARLDEAHRTVVDGWTYTGHPDDGRTPPMPSHENWPLTSADSYVRMISTGAYFFRTFRSGDDDTDASADDLRITALVAALSGDAIPVGALLETYVSRIVEWDGDDFPVFLVASQFAQLHALARSDLLSGDETTEAITNTPTHDMTEPSARADGGTAASPGKLESFIESTPALRHEERRAAYLLGALVGAVGSYQQYHEGRSTTLVDQFPVKAISRTRVKKVTQEAIGKLLTYTRQERRGITMFEWIVNPLRETIVQGDPETWEIGTDDLRFYYALGVTYGMNDRPTSDGEGATDSESETASDIETTQ